MFETFAPTNCMNDKITLSIISHLQTQLTMSSTFNHFVLLSSHFRSVSFQNISKNIFLPYILIFCISYTCRLLTRINREELAKNISRYPELWERTLTWYYQNDRIVTALACICWWILSIRKYFKFLKSCKKI
jgi:hypothetical protein